MCFRYSRLACGCVGKLILNLIILKTRTTALHFTPTRLAKQSAQEDKTKEKRIFAGLDMKKMLTVNPGAISKSPFSLRSQMFFHGVNVTVKSHRPHSSADDLMCVKAEGRGKYNNRWRGMETFMSCWEKMKGARRKKKKKKKRQVNEKNERKGNPLQQSRE